MTVSDGPSEVGEKELLKEWPIAEGLEAGTTKTYGRNPTLQPTERLRSAGWGSL